MTRLRIITAIALLALLGSLLHQRAKLRALRAENTALRAQLTAAHQAPATPAQPSAAESGRIQRERTELMRLRGEVTLLKRQLQTQSPAPAHTVPAPAPPDNAQDALPRFRKFASASTHEVPSGAAIVTGGWQTEPGKRAFVFLTPTALDQTQTADPNARQLLVQGKILELPDAFMQTGAMAALSHDTASDTYSGAITAEQMEALWEQARETEGVNILSTPKMISTDGHQAQIKITDTVTGPNGEQIPLGPQIDLLPRIKQNGAIELIINSTLTLPPPNPPLEESR